MVSKVQQQYNLNMFFANKSPTTKAIELYFKRVGGVYLRAALGEFVTSISLQTSVKKPVSVTSSTYCRYSISATNMVPRDFLEDKR
ncbi:hypothetical protein TSMEX_009459 [Taenia solium]|eukprot:TsM_000397300 transcript=TsM_000397300 gene=TsM_000397300